MVKFLILYLFVYTVIVSATKKEPKSFVGMMEKLKRKPPDDDFRVIAVKKQLFQDIFTDHQKDNKLQFGHVCENPVHWEQRFEEKDFLNNRHRGKVKWGDAEGGYGEQYWDLNHK